MHSEAETKPSHCDGDHLSFEVCPGSIVLGSCIAGLLIQLHFAANISDIVINHTLGRVFFSSFLVYFLKSLTIKKKKKRTLTSIKINHMMSEYSILPGIFSYQGFGFLKALLY